MTSPELTIYGGILAGVLGCYFFVKYVRLRRSVALRRSSEIDGLMEPPSLHPLIDPLRCIGCRACVAACPESNVLGTIGGKATLIAPSHCIGHGACKEACPVDAITLVFGTESRGVDIPQVDPDFQTDVPGIFIAGELGGMGLIRNAIEQGRQAVESIRRVNGLGRKDRLDLVIVGAGPAGLAASLTAMSRKLSFVTLEQESLGGTVSHYPRGKLVMTAPAKLPLVGQMKFTETTKEQLLEFWSEVCRKTGLAPKFQERVESVERSGDGFAVKTNRTVYKCRTVLLAIGRRGTPRKLGVPGEELPKVVYRVIDPSQYRGQRVLVVGGGDSALEAAASIADEQNTTVTLSYRSEAFSRAKEKNRKRIEAAQAAGRMRILLKSNVKKIENDSVSIEQEGTMHDIDNDTVIVSAGGVLPTAFLKQIGITVETKYGTA